MYNVFMTNRNQHTNPQFYLRPFLSPGFVYRRGAVSPIRTQSPRRVGVQEDYYYGGDDPTERSWDNINSRIESAGAPAFRKLIAAETTITSDDWLKLSWLLANLALRTPVYINELRHANLEMIAQMNQLLDLQIAALPPGTEFDSSTLDQINEFRDRLMSPRGHLEAIPFIALSDVAECIRKDAVLLVRCSY